MSQPLPIIGHHYPRVTPRELEATEQVAAAIERELPELQLPERFHNLVPTRLENRPTLHLDDHSAISHFDNSGDARFYQERARLRAGDGDIVATSLPVAAGYEQYCCQQLGLGSVRWVHPHPPRNSNRLAEACWEDDVVRTELICRARTGDLRYVHPNMGTLSVWELAAFLREESQQLIQVIAPHPSLTAWTNDKIEFTRLVQRFFGQQYVPQTMSAGNFAMLADHVKELAASSATIGIKFADSAGGDGTVVLDAKRFASQSLRAVRQELMTALVPLDWDGEQELLVDRWESQIVSSPSVQLWIPLADEGEPIVEGLFIQAIEGNSGVFVGSTPADLPDRLAQDIVNRSWLLAKIFQHLGYVGRCSFDTILVGESIEESRFKFIECNGRWGDTSAPMTLMNRLFGDWREQPYVSRVCHVPNLASVEFLDVTAALSDQLYDRRTGSGRVILSLPGRIAQRSGISIIALGADTDDASRVLEDTILPKISELRAALLHKSS